VVKLITAYIISMGLLTLSATAQTYNPKVDEQEIAIQHLTGQVETLEHEVRLLQDTLKRFQKDTDFRLNELEKAKLTGQAAPVLNSDTITPQAMDDDPPPSVRAAQKKTDSANTATITGGTVLPLGSRESATKAEPPTIEDKPKIEKAEPLTPKAQYDKGLAAFNAKKYQDAETEFQSLIEHNPKHTLVPNAYYWLGESCFAQKKYSDAANSFLNGYKANNKGNKAGHNLLKLGVSLGAMGKKDEACTTLQAAAVKFGDSDAALKKAATTQKQKLGCS
jgi:tol-pal system protein YbgF